MDALRDVVLNAANGSRSSDIRIKCPSCSPNRKLINRNIPTLSITVTGNKATYCCHHCDVKGAVPLRELYQPTRITTAIRPRPQPLVTEITEAGLAFLKSRGLAAPRTEASCAEGPIVGSCKVWFRELGREGEAIAFRYKDAFKFRSIEGKYFACSGAPRTFFGLEPDCTDPIDTLIITEGELDCLAVGLTSSNTTVVSIPKGASNPPQSERGEEPSDNGKLSFLGAYGKLLDGVKRVIIATDADAPGQYLAQELARRIGKAKCLLVSFPDGCKDANDVLLKHGREMLERLLSEATPFPIAGLHSANEFQVHVSDLYKNGLEKGLSTGWPTVDKILTIKPGMLYIVTGIPGSGKSTFVNALTTHLAKSAGWSTVMASFENPIPIHIANLSAVYIGKPFRDTSGRMSPDEAGEAQAWINNNFMFMSCDSEPPTVKSILDRAKAGLLRIGARIVVVDPANFLQHNSSDQTDINVSVDEALTQFKSFAMANDIAFFLVAHPRKPSYSASSNWHPSGYDISGTAGYFNRADIGITIHRTDDDFTKAIVWKARFNHIATNGEATLSYDQLTGRFSESYTRQERPGSQDPWLEE